MELGWKHVAGDQCDISTRFAVRSTQIDEQGSFSVSDQFHLAVIFLDYG